MLQVPVVLIVDDDYFSRDSLAKLLNRRGFEAITAPSVSEGLRLYKEHQPSAIICDNLKLGGRHFLQHPEVEGCPLRISHSGNPDLPAMEGVIAHPKCGNDADLVDMLNQELQPGITRRQFIFNHLIPGLVALTSLKPIEIRKIINSEVLDIAAFVSEDFGESAKVAIKQNDLSYLLHSFLNPVDYEWYARRISETSLLDRRKYYADHEFISIGARTDIITKILTNLLPKKEDVIAYIKSDNFIKDMAEVAKERQRQDKQTVTAEDILKFRQHLLDVLNNSQQVIDDLQQNNQKCRELHKKVIDEIEMQNIHPRNDDSAPLPLFSSVHAARKVAGYPVPVLSCGSNIKQMMGYRNQGYPVASSQKCQIELWKVYVDACRNPDLKGYGSEHSL